MAALKSCIPCKHTVCICVGVFVCVEEIPFYKMKNKVHENLVCN